MNELQKIEAMPIVNMNDLVVAGKLLSESCMFGADTAAKGFVIATACHQEKMSLMGFQRTYHIIDNSPSMKADAMLARFLELGGKYTIVEKSATRAAISLEIDGRKLEDSFTWEEAKQERYVYNKDGKTLKDNWSTPRRVKQMLWARLVSDTVRTIEPRVNNGVYTPDETENFGPAGKAVPVEKVVNPEAAAKMAKVKPQSKPKPETVDVKPKAGKVAAENEFERCQIPGPMLNVAWHEMETDVLNQALQVKHECMKQGHIELIKRVIAGRGGK